MHELSALELSLLIEELQRYVDSYVEKFYEIEEDKFRIKLKKDGSEHNILCILCKSLNNTEYIEKIDNPTNFSLAVRKRIIGYKISAIKQLGNDRILQISLQKKDESVYIILEMFGKGNFIITDSNMQILLAYKVHEFKDRAVKPKSIYQMPKKENAATNFEQLFELYKEKRTIQFFSSICNIGAIYIENELLILNIDPKSKLNTIGINKANEIMKLLERISSNNFNRLNTVYQKDNSVVDYSIMELKKYENFDKKQFETLEKMFEFIYAENAPIYSNKINPEFERILNSINKQKNILKNIDNEIDENKIIGKFIFEHMNILNHLLSEIKENENIDIEKLQILAQGFNIIKVDKKEKLIEIEMVDQ